MVRDLKELPVLGLDSVLVEPGWAVGVHMRAQRRMLAWVQNTHSPVKPLPLVGAEHLVPSAHGEVLAVSGVGSEATVSELVVQGVVGVGCGLELVERVRRRRLAVVAACGLAELGGIDCRQQRTAGKSVDRLYHNQHCGINHSLRCKQLRKGKGRVKQTQQ